MAAQVNLTMHEGNDETVAITVTSANGGGDLSGVARLDVVLKPDGCASDDDQAALVLSSTSASEVVILTQDTDEITAEAYVPASYLQSTYDRVYRVDAIGSGGERRTAVYGAVTVIDT